MPRARHLGIVVILALGFYGAAVFAKRRSAASDLAPVLPRAPLEAPSPERLETIAAASAAASTVTADAQALREALRPAILVDGPPSEADRGAWRPYSRGLALLDRALERPGSFVQEDDSPRPGWTFPLDERDLALQTLGSALVVRGWDRALDGDVDAGLGDMLKAVSLGLRLLDSQSRVVSTMIGWGLVNRGTTEIEQLTRTLGAADPELTQAAIVGLGPALDQAPVGWRAAEADCLATLRGHVEAFSEHPVVVSPWGRYPVSPVLAPVLIDTRQTLESGLAICRHGVEQARLPYALRADPAANRPASPSPWDTLGNLGGAQLIEAFGDYDTPVGMEDQGRARVAGVWSVLSARAYLAEHDAIPTARQLLLPDDPFTGRPLAIVDGVITSTGDAAMHPKTPLRWVIRVELEE